VLAHSLASGAWFRYYPSRCRRFAAGIGSLRSPLVSPLRGSGIKYAGIRYKILHSSFFILHSIAMRFSFEHLGVVRRADIEIGNLTVLCGANNTGKTYITYAVWGMYRALNSKAEQLRQITLASNTIDDSDNNANNNIVRLSVEKTADNLHKELSNAMQFSSSQLNMLFNINTSELNFNDTKINILLTIDDLIKKLSGLHMQYKIDEKKYDKMTTLGQIILFGETSNMDNITIEYPTKEENQKILASISSFNIRGDYKTIVDYLEYLRRNISLPFDLFKYLFPFKKQILFTAQRDSIELFYKSIDKTNSEVIREFQTSRDISLLDNLAKFSLPLQDNIDFARELPIKQTSYLSEEHPELVKEIETLLGVEYIYDGTSSNHYIKTAGQTELIPIHTASTSVRALMHLHYWLKHLAQEGDLLMIDEPELNLHPRNQIKMARLFAKLVNVGIKVWITTHSDYIVKELNNLVMLGSVENIEKTLEELNLNRQKDDIYRQNEILKAEDLRAYVAKMSKEEGGAIVEQVPVDKYGMLWSAFDAAIDEITDVANTLANNIKDENE
jgi:predicted ATP-dependent endonuclease of OLD family